MIIIVCHALLLHIACPSVWAWIQPSASPSEETKVEIYTPGENETAQLHENNDLDVSDEAMPDVSTVVLSLLSNELMLSEDTQEKPPSRLSLAQQRALEAVLYLTYAIQTECRLPDPELNLEQICYRPLRSPLEGNDICMLSEHYRGALTNSHDRSGRI